MPPNRNRMQATKPKKPPTRTPPARTEVPEQSPAKADDPVSVIAAALWGVMAAVGYVQKTGLNDFHHYTYASESDALTALRPEMIKQGLMLIPSGQKVSEIDQHGNITVEIAYTLLHKSGARWPEPIIAFGAGNDKARGGGGVGDKGLYKALTGANKYLLFKLFQLATGDDPETADAGHEPGPVNPPADPGGDRGKGRDAPQGGDRAPELMSEREQNAFLEELKVRIDGAKTGEAVTQEMLSERTQQGLRIVAPEMQQQVRKYAEAKFRKLKPKSDPPKGEGPKPEAKPNTTADDPEQDQLPD